jgi:hypothetical protein
MTRGIIAWRGNWHHASPRLETLNVVLNVEMGQECPRGDGQQRIHKEWLNGMSVENYVHGLKPKARAMKPRVFGSKVEYEGCPPKDELRDGRCACTRLFERNFVAMIMAERRCGEKWSLGDMEVLAWSVDKDQTSGGWSRISVYLSV